MEAQITFTDAANLIYAQSDKKDQEILSLLEQIEKSTQELTCSSFSNKDKYDIIVGTEYIFCRVRILVEFEAIKVKKLLNDTTTPPALKPFFTKRSVFLSEVSAKLSLIRDDINVLQRVQYSQTNNFIKN